MKLFTSIILTSVFGLLLTSCEETIQLDINQTQPKIVIEGLVTDQPGYQSVKVSRSADFYSKEKGSKITNAIVTVTDNAGNVFPFVHNPENKDDSVGIYFPQSSFVGVVGRTYKLKVVVDGNVYEAQDNLFPVTKIDSLTVKMDKDEAEDPEIEGRIYDLLLFTKEPHDQTNYYLFKFFRNDSLVYANDTDIYYSDDEFLAEKIDGVESPLLYSIGDKATVEMYSITRTGYVYFSDLSTLLNNDAGGMFGPIPAPPRTNLTNGALGFFQVSALDIGKKNIE